MTAEVVRSYCRICSPCCGVLVEVDDQVVTSVRGDPDHPVSRGYVCPKGRALGQLHHDARRLDVPEVRFDDRLVPTTWETALDDLAHRIRAAVDAHGPDAVAVYQGTPALHETAALPVVGALTRRLGSRSRYSSLTVDVAARLTVTPMVLGAQLIPVVDVDDAALLLVVGTNPVVSHAQVNGLSDPVTRLREIGERGEVWVIDPRRTETAHHATRHVPLRPGTDHALLAHLVRSVLADGVDEAVRARLDGIGELQAAVEPFDRARTARDTGIPDDVLADLVAAIERTGRLALLTGTGVTMARSANVTEWLAWALLLLTDSFDRAGGMWCNPTYLGRRDRHRLRAEAADDGNPGPASRPDLPRFLGEHPCAALADEIDAGTVKVLISFGGNPLVAIAEPDRLRAALAALDAFAIVGTVRDEQADLATHVLPCTGMLERADALLFSQGAQLKVTTQYTPAVVAPVAERRPAWWIAGQLGRRLGLDLLPGELDVDSATDDDVLAALAGGPEVLAELQAADGPLVAEDRVTDWALDALPGRPQLAPPALVDQLTALAEEPAADAALRLVPRRLLRRFNSVHSPTGRQDRQEVLLHPDAAAAAGVVDGAAVRVRSEHGSLVGTASVREGIDPGAVAISHGFTDVHVGRLTSATADVDPLSGQITQTGIPVRVAPA